MSNRTLRLLLTSSLIFNLILLVGFIVVLVMVQQPFPVVPTAQPSSLFLVVTPTPVRYVQIVVAVRDIPEGTTITDAMVGYVLWPADAAPMSVMFDEADVIGTTANTDIYREMLILEPMLEAEGD
jgi:Flp pilus assembly protein CpaB